VTKERGDTHCDPAPLALSASKPRENGQRLGGGEWGRNGWIFPQESPGSAHNETEGPLVEIGSCSVLSIRRSVSGSSQRGMVLGGSGEWRVAREQWPVAREQWSVVSEYQEMILAVIEKRQNKANCSWC